MEKIKTKKQQDPKSLYKVLLEAVALCGVLLFIQPVLIYDGSNKEAAAAAMQLKYDTIVPCVSSLFAV